MKVLLVSLAIIGTIIGSGFISGKEIVVFFSNFGLMSFFCIILVFILFFYLFRLLLNYNLNEKITPYIALVNPGNDSDVSSLILNPTNLLMFEKVKEELSYDESLSQTLRLVATKKETEADIKYTLVKNDGEKDKVINIPKNIEKTHPYTTTEVIKKIKETLELSLCQNHGFTSNKFQDICKRKGIKSNQDYCYQFTYSKNTINKYNDLAIEYISQIYIDEYKKQKSCE